MRAVATLAPCDEAGGRFSGTQSEREAKDFIAGKLTEYGLPDIHLEPRPS